MFWIIDFQFQNESECFIYFYLNWVSILTISKKLLFFFQRFLRPSVILVHDYLCMSRDIDRALPYLSFFTYNIYIFRLPFLGDRSSGSEIGELEDESRSDLGISDNEDTNSIISQTMSSLLRKDSTKERSPIIDIGFLRNNKTNITEVCYTCSL